MLVWARESSEMEDSKIPDIMLSLGAGVQNKTLQSTVGSRRATIVLPSGVRERVAALHQMYKATLDDEQVFKDFSRSFERQSELQSRCHRLNIVLDDQPCRLDDVDQLEKLQSTAKRFLREDSEIPYNPKYKNAYSHIQAVASKIRASLFYFDVTRIQQMSVRNSEVWEITGRLRCRLKRQFSSQFLHLLEGIDHGSCRFRVRRCRRNAKSHTWNFVPADWDIAKFSVEAAFVTSDRSSIMAVEMTFGESEAWEMISGFPRVLEVTHHRVVACDMLTKGQDPADNPQRTTSVMRGVPTSVPSRAGH